MYRHGTLLNPYDASFVTYDLEFIDDGETIDLVSIAMVSGDGRRMYAINRELDEHKLLTHGDGWMRKNVWPHLPLKDLPEKKGYGRFPNEVEKKCHCPSINGETGYKAEYACFHMNGRLDRDHPNVRPRGQIRRLVSDFIQVSHPVDRDMHRDNVKLWAYYGAYDHVCLAQLWGPMIGLPSFVPMITHDLKSEAMRLGVPVPEQKGGNHDALADAEHNLVKARFLWQIATGKTVEKEEESKA